MANPLKGEVIRLYKTWVAGKLVPISSSIWARGGVHPGQLLYLGREYPKGAAYFRERLKFAFMKNKDETDPEKIKQLVARGDHVIKELEALYFLRKYRAMKKRYYEPEN
ncbi:LYR motif-containing protein 5A [Ameca splendens]|uniref:LYR motif-containing protein 5A n=1 Tax=Ameca splendens TaxID=208324 RepID=A0ABV0XMG5_9TELE